MEKLIQNHAMTLTVLRALRSEYGKTCMFDTSDHDYWIKLNKLIFELETMHADKT